MKPLGLELGNARGADIACEGHHADGIGDLGELGEPRDDLALGLLVMFEEDHQNTLIRSATCLSTSVMLGLPVVSWPRTCAYSAEPANARSASTRFGTYGCERNSSA